MTRNVTVLAAALLVGCTGSDKDTKDKDTGTPTTGPSCANGVSLRFPATGDADVYYKSDVRFTLEAEDDAATIDVTDSTGAAVTGDTSVTGTLVTWDGDDFDPSAAYTAVLHYECGEDTITFTTSATGEPADGPSLEGKVYALDLEHGQWIEPTGLGPLIATQLAGTQILASPTTVAADKITMLGAIGSADTQDLCSPTIDFPPADFTNPYFELTAKTLPLTVAGFTIDITDLTLSGAFSPTGDRIQGVTLGGTVDTSTLGQAFDLGDAPDTICALGVSFGVSCIECPGGTGPYCITVYVDSILAPSVVSDPLVPRTQEEVDADTDCGAATGT